MKGLIKKLLFFSCGLLAIFLLILLIPVDKRLRFQNLENDCFDHGLWIHDRMFIDPRPIDMVFLGSSLTVNGINDQLIEDSLQAKKLKVANFGYCRLGRNLSYTLLKDLYKNKKAKHIIIEVKDDEDLSSHPIFPYMADEEDVYLPYLLFNGSFISDMYKAFMFKVQLLQQVAFDTERNAAIRGEKYGFASSIDTANAEMLQQFKISRSTPRPYLRGVARYVSMKFPRHYLEKIAELAKGNNATITFLYFPSYGSVLEKPHEYNTYLKYGKVLIPPKEIMENPNNWHDDIHLNQAGATKLSVWLAKEGV